MKRKLIRIAVATTLGALALLSSPGAAHADGLTLGPYDGMKCDPARPSTCGLPGRLANPIWVVHGILGTPVIGPENIVIGG